MDFNVEPFWDDFEAANGAKEFNYMRILFRPGYSVQARELTQLQSILQNQIKSFGDHIFKDGSPVYGGHLTIDTAVNYLKLEPSYAGEDIDVADYLDRVIFNVTGTAKKRAKVISYYDNEVTPTLMIRYLRGTQFIAGENITLSDGSPATVLSKPNINPNGKGSVVHIDTGVFYVNGFFVYVLPQTIVLDAYSSTPTYRIGLEIDEDIIDESADASLLDPAQSSFNYQAPGAYRYKFGLTLAKRSLDSIDDQRFFELMRVENGVITKFNSDPLYSRIEDVFARRTYDESGDYVVSPFGISLKANTDDDSKIIAAIQPGKAYVGGYEYSSISTQKVDINKALTSETKTDYDLSLEYGNYIITKDLYINPSVSPLVALPNIDNGMVTVDLHCVPNNNVNFSSAITYNTTFMGTATLLNLDRSGSDYITHYADFNVTSNTITTSEASINTKSIVFTGYSTLKNAYANAQVRILTGPSAGEVRKIIDYTYASSKGNATVDSAFSSTIGSGVKVELTYGINHINSILQVLPNKSAANLSMNVSSRSKYAGTSNTFIGNSNGAKFIFPLPDNYVKQDTIVNADYYYRKYIPNKLFDLDTILNDGNCVLTINEFSNDAVYYGTNGSDMSDATILENFIVLNKTTGAIITPLRVRRTSPTNISIYYATGGFYADVYMNVKVDNSETAGRRRSKTMVGDYTTDALSESDTVPLTGSVTGQTSVKIDSTNGFIWFTDNSVISKEPNGRTSLYLPDVFNVKAVYDSQDPTAAPTSTNSIEITDRFIFDSGQRDMYYDHAALILRPGATAPKGQIVVLCQYYEHQIAKGYFSVDSYSSTEYGAGRIPVYLSNSGILYNLRDCIDFRPTRTGKTTATSFVGFQCIKPNIPMELTYEYYLPRVDSIVITRDKQLKVVEGAPGKNPLPPIVSETSMPLYTINLPAFTANVSEVRAEQVQHKRYTMKDIGTLETRIDRLEYYTAMTMSEKTSKEKVVLYQKDGTQKEKYGILVDNFKAFDIADTNSYDFHAAVDSGTLFPVTDINTIELEYKSDVSQSVKVNDKTISLPYTETVAIEQLSATSNCSVQPYMYGIFDGILFLSPESDSMHSYVIPPVIVDNKNTIVTETNNLVVSNSRPRLRWIGGGVYSGNYYYNPAYNHYYRWFNNNLNRPFMVERVIADRSYSFTPIQTLNVLMGRGLAAQ